MSEQSEFEVEETAKKDIFDKIMSLKLFKFACPFYKKHKEPLLYIFFGALTTLVNIIVFVLFTKTIILDELVANFIAWFIAVLFAYVTNRTWVFNSSYINARHLIREMLSFYSGRIFTLLVEELILWLFIKILFFSALPVKIVVQVLIIVLNYVISKLFVFVKKKRDNDDTFKNHVIK